ncbi:MAG: hypothetical protein AAF985_07285, partial [Bacteroidota bacterium]
MEKTNSSFTPDDLDPSLWLENPQRFSAGQEAPHANLAIQEQSHYLSLNGKWTFRWSPNCFER